MARSGREMWPDILERIGCAVAERVAGVPANEAIEPRRRSETKLHARMCGDIVHELSPRARSDDEDAFLVDDERQQPGLGRFHELIVIERAGLALAFREGFVSKSEPPCQRMDIAVFIDNAGGDEYTIGADSGLDRALFHRGDNLERQ